MAVRYAIKLKRHYGKLSGKDTEALVGAVADLIVTYIKGRSADKPKQPADAPPEQPEIKGTEK